MFFLLTSSYDFGQLIIILLKLLFILIFQFKIISTLLFGFDVFSFSPIHLMIALFFIFYGEPFGNMHITLTSFSSESIKLSYISKLKGISLYASFNSIVVLFLKA